MSGIDLIKPLARGVLARAHEFEWTLQGLGMLRTYLSDDVRLHVWDDRFAVPGVSALHTHPWDMTSLVVAGEVRQHRYVSQLGDALTHWAQSLKCGAGGGLESEPRRVALSRQPEERYTEGQTYEQSAHEIHESLPLRGTVTLVRRRFLPDRDHAHVFWPIDEEWGSAEPRPASAHEVTVITTTALRTWF